MPCAASLTHPWASLVLPHRWVFRGISKSYARSFGGETRGVQRWTSSRLSWKTCAIGTARSPHVHRRVQLVHPLESCPLVLWRQYIWLKFSCAKCSLVRPNPVRSDGVGAHLSPSVNLFSWSRALLSEKTYLEFVRHTFRYIKAFDHHHGVCHLSL